MASARTQSLQRLASVAASVGGGRWHAVACGFVAGAAVADAAAQAIPRRTAATAGSDRRAFKAMFRAAGLGLPRIVGGYRAWTDSPGPGAGNCRGARHPVSAHR